LEHAQEEISEMEGKLAKAEHEEKRMQELELHTKELESTLQKTRVAGTTMEAIVASLRASNENMQGEMAGLKKIGRSERWKNRRLEELLGDEKKKTENARSSSSTELDAETARLKMKIEENVRQDYAEREAGQLKARLQKADEQRSLLEDSATRDSAEAHE